MIFFLDINIEEEEGKKIHVNKLPSLNQEKKKEKNQDNELPSLN